MSHECSECERDLRGGHDVECSRWARFELEMRNWGEECSPVQCAVVEHAELMEMRRRLARAKTNCPCGNTAKVCYGCAAVAINAAQADLARVTAERAELAEAVRNFLETVATRAASPADMAAALEALLPDWKAPDGPALLVCDGWASDRIGEEQTEVARVTAERDEAVALAERLQAGWDSNAQIGTQALADLRRTTDAMIEVGRLALRVEQERDNALAALAEWQELAAQKCTERDTACAENARLRSALQVLADPDNYTLTGPGNRFVSWRNSGSPSGVARAALAGEVPSA